MSNAQMWTSEKRLYLLPDGRVVEEDGVTDRAVLLVGAGGQLPRADAERYGLLAPPAAPEPASKQQAAPPATKAQRGPKATK